MYKRYLILIGLTIVVLNSANGQSTDGRDSESLNALKTSVSFLTIAPDSKAGAMGDAGVATTPDINSQHWNPSKFPFVKEQSGVAVSYTPWLRGLGVTDLNLLYLTGYRKFGNDQAVSSALRYFNLGEISEIDINAVATGNKIRPHELAFDLGYSRMFSENFGGGLVFRFIYSNIAAGASNLTSGARYEPGTSYAADLSAYYQKPIQLSNYNAEMAYGLNISNIGSKMSYSEDNESQFIPTNMRLGGRLTMDIDDYNQMSFTIDLNKLLVPTPQPNDTAFDMQKIGVIEGVYKSFYDAPGGGSEELHELMWSVGAEYLYMKQFAIRAGYFNEYETKGNRKYFTLGAGFNLNVFSLDFSYLFPATGGRANPLANTMRFTLGFRFE
ncbi:MAG: type IX secretion system outer membrane channel protein PorV [Bacteroidales bacterium]|nr:type IX secretion system outer membrane channel protein PorV [Bacteroidales bacterium]